MHRIHQLDCMTAQGLKVHAMSVSSSSEASSLAKALSNRCDARSLLNDSFEQMVAASEEDSLRQLSNCSPPVFREWSDSCKLEQTGSSGDSAAKRAAMFPTTGRKHMDLEDYKKWSLEKIKVLENQMAAIPNKRDPLYKKLGKQRQA